MKVQTKHLFNTLSALAPFADGPHPFILVDENVFVAMGAASLAVATIPIERLMGYKQSLLIPTDAGELDLIIKSLKTCKDPKVQIETPTPNQFGLSCLPSTTFHHPSGITFPPWRELFPTTEEGTKRQENFALSPTLLGRSAKSAKAFDPKGSDKFQVRVPSALEPVVFCYESSWGGVLKILLMPTVSAESA